MKKLSELLKPWGAIPAFADRDIQRLTLDSRQVAPGNLFFAYPGEKSDGRQFIKEAIAQGAAAILYESPFDLSTLQAEADQKNVLLLPMLAPLAKQVGDIAARFYDDPAKELIVIGVTGTNGKTSCTHFLAQFFHAQQIKCGVLGTVGNGIYPNLQSSPLTTLDPISLQAKIREFVAAGATYLVMEVSSHSLVQERVAGIPFTAALFTNLTQDHLDYHKTMEAYAEAKGLLFARPELKCAVLNSDDETGRSFAKRFSANKKTVKYSAENVHADVHASHIQAAVSGYEMNVTTPWGAGHLPTRLVGRFNVSNLLGVLGVLGCLGFAFEKMMAGLATVLPPAGRMQTFGGNGKPLVVVDYAHTPDALEQALRALRPHVSGKLWCVFGCGGNRDRTKRPLMAAIAEQFSDRVVITNDNPREEKPEAILEDILKGIAKREVVQIELDRYTAIANAIHAATVQDVILIAGKGHEDYQIIGTEKIHYSDVESVERVLAGG